MAMPNLAERHWTPEDVLALPEDGNRYECIDGALLVTPAPRALHQFVATEFYDLVAPFAKAQALGRLNWSPADIRIQARTLVQPDLFIALKTPDAAAIREWSDVGGLLLAVEVLSSTTARYDRGLKRLFYQRAGVHEYWIVDPDAALVERWRPADERPEILRESLRWHPGGAADTLEIDLPALFERAARG